MSGEREQRVYSVRLSGADLRKLKTVAGRLQVSESDLIRFALRNTLVALAPLQDDLNRGTSLLPLFVDHGDYLTRYFNLDMDRLEEIINAGADHGRQIDREDIGLLLLCGDDKTRLFARLRELTDMPMELDSVMTHCRDYLYQKYLYSYSEAP